MIFLKPRAKFRELEKLSLLVEHLRFQRRYRIRHHDLDAGIVDISFGLSLVGEHLLDGFLIILDKCLEKAHSLIAHLERVLDDHGVDITLAHVTYGTRLSVERDDRVIP